MLYRESTTTWERPTRADLEDFFKVMDALAGKRVLVHCAANKRVSVFMALYRRLRHDWALGATLPDVQAIWEPDAVWRQFMEEMMQQLVTRHSSA